MSRYRVLALTWRPKRFEEVVGQPHVVTALSNAITLNKIPQCMLFTGTRGVGKTTIARILAKCLNCLEGPTATPCQTCDHCTEINAGRFPDLYEVDAASRTKVEDTRELLDNIPYSPTKGRYKVYLIDEVHMLSTHSFNALLKTLEEPPEHVIFLLATTDPQKLPATVLSRCLQFKLQAMASDQIDTHLQHILTEEKIEFDRAATAQIADAAKGSMRDALSLLDQGIAHGNGSVHTQAIQDMLGTVAPEPLFNLLQSLATQDADALLAGVLELRRLGTNFSTALKDFCAIIQQMAVAQVLNSSESRIINQTVTELSTQFSSAQTQALYQTALKGMEEMPFSPTPEIGFEMTLLRMRSVCSGDIQVQQPITVAAPVRAAAAQPAAARPVTHTPTQPASAARRTRPAASAPVAAPQKMGNADDSWSQVIASSSLRGLSLVLAQNCHLQKQSDGQWDFTLDIKQKPLLQPRTQDALNAALSAHIGTPMRAEVTITTEATHTDTPAIKTQPVPQNSNGAVRDTAQPAPVNPIHADPEVERIVQTFSGTLSDNCVVNSNNN